MSESEIVTTVVSSISLVISVTALLASRHAMVRQRMLNSAISVVNWLEEVRNDRLLLYEVERQGRDHTQWSDREKEAAEKVCRKLDVLGMFESLGYLDQRLVDRFYAIPAKDMWDICKGWVTQRRSERGQQLFWEFEKLADRVEHVKRNHPAVKKTEKWSRNPRHQKPA